MVVIPGVSTVSHCEVTYDEWAEFAQDVKVRSAFTIQHNPTEFPRYAQILIINLLKEATDWAGSQLPGRHPQNIQSKYSVRSRGCKQRSYPNVHNNGNSIN